MISAGIKKLYCIQAFIACQTDLFLTEADNFTRSDIHIEQFMKSVKRFSGKNIDHTIS